MHYTFPKIETINDVLPAIEGKDEFIVIYKDKYKIIDYVLQAQHTFPNPDTHLMGKEREHKAVLRECRGLAFYPDGKLMSRPFHKFFNSGEKPDEEKGLTTISHVLLKLDGSMIRPFYLDGHIRLATRKGITDVAMQAEVFIADKPNYVELMLKCIAENRTPVFEWCSRKNQIVIDYDVESLILLAIRDNYSGHYFTHEYVQSFGKHYNVPVVPEFLVADDVTHWTGSDYAAYTKTLKDMEGCVLVYPNGHKLKAKGEWYTTLHKAKDMIGREKDMIKIFLAGELDDLLPLFSEKDRVEINEYLDRLTINLLDTSKRLDKLFQEVMEVIPDDFARKDFALEVLKRDPKYKSLLFSMLAGDEPLNLLTQLLIKACGKNATLEEYRWIFGGIKFKEKKNDAE